MKLKRFFLTTITSRHLVYNTSKSQYIIIGQEITQGKTIFVLRHADQLVKIGAQDLYKNHVLLENLSRKDLITIVSTAIQEQAVDDFAPAVMWQNIEHPVAVDLDYSLGDLDSDT